MILFWVTQAIPKCRLMNHCKTHTQKQSHNGGGKQTTEVETEVMEPQAKEHLEPLVSGMLQPSYLLELPENIFSLIHGSRLQQSQETNIPTLAVTSQLVSSCCFRLSTNAIPSGVLQLSVHVQPLALPHSSTILWVFPGLSDHYFTYYQQGGQAMS